MGMGVATKRMLQTELSLLPISDLALLEARYSWLMLARGDQIPPAGDWSTWVLKAGRGAGKTRTGAEEVWWSAARQQERWALVAPTSNDVRKTMFEGESGLLNVVPDRLMLDYNRSSLEMWIRPLGYEGSDKDRCSLLTGYSSEEPERLRGPQHHGAWCDELAAWKYQQDTWDMLEFTMRLGDDPRYIVTTTPKPSGILRKLMEEPDTVMTEASTMANAKNLPKKFLEKLLRKYEGTRLGRQELYAEMIGDNPYALWQAGQLEEIRVSRSDLPDMIRIVVAVDPPVTSGEDSDECGIVVAGEGTDGKWYVLEDVSEQGCTPSEWAELAVSAYHRHAADAIVAEVNQGGDMVELTVRTVDPTANYRAVRATRGKVVRAEPVAALYEQNSIRHLGRLGTLEDQMCDFTTDFDKKQMGYSPDRVDALVWALTDLALDGEGGDPRIRGL